eukprot:74356_1
MLMRLFFLISLIVSISCDLTIHNQARRQAGVYKDLRWSSKLQSSAKQVAQWLCNTGKWQHSRKGCSSSGCRPYGVGENLAGHGNLQNAARAWLAEKQYWKNGRCQSGKVCGHYTQMISKYATKLGCYTQKCRGGGMSGRTICHYADDRNSNAFEENVAAELECEATDYDGDLCLYTNGDDAEPMRFTVSQMNGCELEEKVFEHSDVAQNRYYLHFVPQLVENNETLAERWLVSRDYVSDVALFWCDSWDLMQCTKGEWSKNVFEELGVSQEVDGEITIKKCASIDDDAARQEEASAVIIPVVIIAVLLVIVGLSLYLFTRYRSKQKMKQMKVIVDNEEEADEEELDVTVPVITN